MSFCLITKVFHIPHLNISHLYPVPQPVTKTIIKDGDQWLDDVKKLLERDNLEDGEFLGLRTTPALHNVSIIHVAIVYEVFHQPSYGLAYNENYPCCNQVFES